MLRFQKEHLPMEKFAKGDFSEAHRIIEVFSAYKKRIEDHLLRKHTGGEKDIQSYLQKQLARLEEEHIEWTEKKNQALRDIKDIQQKIDQAGKDLQDQGKGDKYRNRFCEYLKDNGCSIHILQEAFDKSIENKPQAFIDEVTKVFDTFIISARVYQKIFDEENDKLYQAKKTREEATRNLSHKSNRQNLEKQISDIKKGKAANEIIGSVKKEICKEFRKMDHLDDMADERSLQEMFISILATTLITDSKTDKRVKMDLIRNHTDKIGLFDHIWRIYNENTQMFLEIETGRDLSRGNDHTITPLQEKIDELAHASKEILDKIPPISGFFRLGDDASQEEREARMNKGDKARKDIVVDDLVSHLKHTLEQPQKDENEVRRSDQKLRKLFEGIYIVTDSHEFERYCERLWNLDAKNYRELLKTEGKMLLMMIYKTMENDEREIISYNYDHAQLFEQIEKKILDEEYIEKEKQLKLFDREPIYNIQGYAERASENIQRLIKDNSYRHRWLFEGIIKEMLAEQGHDGYLYTDKEIAPLDEKDFIERVRRCKGGKALSTMLKKAEGKLLPDINERIAEMKKAGKGDIA